MAKKTNMAKKAAVTKKMNAAVANALIDEETIVGRVVGALGNGGFRVSLKSGKEVQGLIRGVFKGGKNSESFVCSGMYVILSPNISREMKVHEIVGIINNRKDLKALKEAGLIVEDLGTDKDDLFDYSEDEDSVKHSVTDKSESVSAKELNEDVDVDAL